MESTDIGECFTKTREDATTRLVGSYKGCLEGRHGFGFVVISGPSGAGKTTLALSLKNFVIEDGGHFLRGKFDQLAYSYEATATLYEPFVDAFTNHIEAVANHGERTVKLVKEALEATLELTERQVLRGLIPALDQIMGAPNARVAVHDQTPIVKGPDAESRFVRIFGLFVKAICSCGIPVVLFLDDIQWATPSDLDLLACLARETYCSGFFLLCTYRNDQTEIDHPWPALLSKLRKEGILVAEIEAPNFSEAEVCTILSSRLHRPLDGIKPLANAVFGHTGGNILFVTMLLDEFDGGSLGRVSTMDLSHFKDCLDCHCQSVEMLVENKIERLPDTAQMLLKLASCLGSKFSEEILAAISPEQVIRMTLILQDTGLITSDSNSRVFHFAHDRFQTVVYSLIPERERGLWHRRVGRRLWGSLSRNAREDNLLLIGHQLSRGAHLLAVPDEKYITAEILSRAGQKAAVSSAFATAASFLNLGIKLLCKKRWVTHYDLCLRIYSFAAEIEYYNGNLNRVDELVTEVLQNARSLEDKLKAQFTRIYSLGSRNEMGKALDESMEVFKIIGEPFPRHPRISNIVMGLIRCNYALRGKSDKSILNLPQMRDWKRLAGMRLMTIDAFYAFYLRDKLLPLMVFRLIKNTLRYGMSDSACVGFALWAHICARRGDVDSATRYGRLALRIHKIHEAKEWQPRVILLVYSAVYALIHPYSKLLGPLRDAHRVGLVVGDLHLSMVNAVMHADLSYFAGKPLAILLDNLTAYQSLCTKYRQLASLAPVELRMQFCLNLMGKSSDPLILTGDTMVEEEMTVTMKERNPLLFTWLHVLKLTLAVYMNNLPVAQSMSRRLSRLPTDEAIQCLIAAYLFFDGMVAAMSSRTDPKEGKRAVKILVKLKKFADNAPSNYLHRVRMVEAEMATSAGKYDDAVAKYQQSIAHAGRHGLIHEQALACERFSHALQLGKRSSEARHHLLKARSLYDEWGAKVKYDQIMATVLAAPRPSDCPGPT